MEAIRSILKHHAGQEGVGVLERVRSSLPPSMKEGYRLERLKDGVLTVACRSAGVAYALAAHRELLKEGSGAETVRFLIRTW